MRKKALSLLLVFALLFSPVPGMNLRVVAYNEGLIFEAVTLYVDSVNGEDSPVYGEGATFKSVAGAILNAQNGDTVKLLTDVNNCEAINIYEKQVTLDLNGHTLKADWSGAGNNYFYIAPAAQLTVDDTSETQSGTISQDTTTSSGKHYRAFDVRGTLILKAGTIENGMPPWQGGAISLEGTASNGGGEFRMEGGTIKNCTSSASWATGGAVYVKGYNRFIMSGGTIENCSVLGNGGGVCVAENGSFTMTGGTITGCSTDSNGGGVYVAEGGSFTMSGGSIANNTAKESVGGVFAGGTLTISGDAVISNNTASGVNSNLYLPSGKQATIQSDFTGTVDVSGEGTLVVEDGAKVENLTGDLAYNEAVTLFVDSVNGEEGSVYREGATFKSVAKAILNAKSGDTVKLLTDVNNCEVINIYNKQVTLDLNGHTLTADWSGAGNKYFYIESGAQLTIDDTSETQSGKISQDTPTSSGKRYRPFDVRGTLVLKAGTIENAVSPWQGGAVFMEGTASNGGAEFRMEGGTIRNCASKESWATGGAVYAAAYSRFIMSGGTIENCSVVGNGGGIYVDKNGSFTMTDGTITGCSTNKNGGGVYIAEGGSLTMRGGSITNNTAKESVGGVFADGTLTIAGDAVISNNTASGVNSNLYLPSGKQATIQSDFTGTVGVSGEGAFAVEDGAKVENLTSDYPDKELVNQNGLWVVQDVPHEHCICGDEHCVIGDHTAEQSVTFTSWESSNSLPTVAGNYYLTADVTLSGSWTPPSGTVLCLNGHVIRGGISSDWVSYTLTDCSDTIHYFDKDGSGKWVLNDSNTSSPNKVNGGVITGGNGIQLSHGSLKAYNINLVGNNNCALENWNQSYGITDTRGTATLYNVSILGNYRSNHGGALYCQHNSLTTLYDSLISQNTCTLGGGVAYLTNTAKLVLNNCTVTDNKTVSASETRGGGAIHLQNGTFEMNGGTMTGNSSAKYNGGAISGAGGNNNVVNLSGKVIIKDNTKDGTPNNFYTNNIAVSLKNLQSGSIITLDTPNDKLSVSADDSIWSAKFLTSNPNVGLGVYMSSTGGAISYSLQKYSCYEVRYTQSQMNPAPAGMPETDYIGQNCTVSVAPPVTVAGYYFNGWTTSDVTVKDGKFTMPAKAVTFTGSWTAKSTPKAEDFTLTPYANLTYDGTEKPATVTATSGMGAVTVKYNGSTTVPKTAGEYTVTVSVAEGERYFAGSDISLGSFTITKATVALPTAEKGLIYNKTEQTGVVLPEGALYTLQDNKKTLADDYTATATLTDKNNYQWKDLNTSEDQTIAWSIAPKTLTLDGITATDRIYDTTVEVALEGGSLTGIEEGDEVSITLPTAGAMTDANAGEGKRVTVVKPELLGASAKSYLLADILGVTVTIAKAEPTYTAPMPQENLIYNGEMQPLFVAGETEHGTLYYSFTGEDSDWHTDANEVVAMDADTYTVYYKLVGDENHLDVVATPLTVVIDTKEMTWEERPYNETYDGWFHSADVVVTEPTEATILYRGPQDTDFSEAKPIFANAGTYTVAYRMTAKNYTEASGTMTVRITPRPVTVSGIAVQNGGKVYDGTTTATLDVSGVTLNGMVGRDDLSVTATGVFTDKNAGENKEVLLSQLALIGADANNYVLSSAGQQSVTVGTIFPKEVALEWTAPKDLTYNGEEKCPSVTVIGALAGESVTATIALAPVSGQGGVNVGAFTYMATGLDDSNYQLGENVYSPNYWILPANLSTASAELDATTLEYSENAQTVGVRVTWNGKTLSHADYTVSGNVQQTAGTYTVIISGCGNFTGTIERSFTILPPPEVNEEVSTEETEAPTEEIGEGQETVPVAEQVSEPAVVVLPMGEAPWMEMESFVVTEEEIQALLVENADGTFTVNGKYADGEQYATLEEALVATELCAAKEKADAIVQELEDGLNAFGRLSVDLTELKEAMIGSVAKGEDGFYTFAGSEETFATLEEALVAAAVLVEEQILESKKEALTEEFQGLQHRCDGKSISVAVDWASLNVEGVTLEDAGAMLSVYDSALSNIRLEKAKQSNALILQEELSEVQMNLNYTADSLVALQTTHNDLQKRLLQCQSMDEVKSLMAEWEAQKTLLLVYGTSMDNQREKGHVSCKTGIAVDAVMSVNNIEFTISDTDNAYRLEQKLLQYASYEIDLSRTSENGQYQVTIPLPEGCPVGGHYEILHVKDDGTTEILQGKYNLDGTVTFTTTGFSNFVVMARENPSVVWGIGIMVLLSACWVLLYWNGGEETAEERKQERRRKK